MSIDKDNVAHQNPITNQIDQYKFEINSLKQIALQGNADLLQRINQRISTLEKAAKVGSSKSLIGRLFAPKLYKDEIKQNKQLRKEIETLKKALNKTENMAEIDNLSRKILFKISNYTGIMTPNGQNLLNKIEYVEANSAKVMNDTRNDIAKLRYRVNQSKLDDSYKTSIGKELDSKGRRIEALVSDYKGNILPKHFSKLADIITEISLLQTDLIARMLI